MKTQRTVLFLIIGVLLSGVFGYRIAMRTVFLSRADYILLLHRCLEHRARAYYFTMTSLKTNGVVPPRELTYTALTCLSNYVQDAMMLSTQKVVGPISINTNLLHDTLRFLNTTDMASLTNKHSGVKISSDSNRTTN